MNRSMASSYTLPPVATLASSPQQLQEVLDHLFEPSPALYSLVASQLPRHFADYAAFADWVAGLLRSGLRGDDETLLSILRAHPRLGAKRVDSVHSQAEQKSLAVADPDEAGRLLELNDEYERTFPGMRYVVFVAGRSRPVIMQNMKERIARGDIEAEKKEAIEAMRDIAKDRAAKLTPQ
ncbi:Oxo-4-hydroxy-4-carboxy-5-ureidoimidazoline decarboxylase [Sphaerosporella brunnea]|uniref:Oxo-4-hydroxy-4-carboxy-5-ureidoimidazoline decarboxylase n=1 Tax=Sphaerosporella brunnea TaxID=1250544 RepID=A0A5J5F2K7_9PEZI|nr:Oxo-4-hydroxy-4-carboxy-5-ureidoimidazoline decarboxylase [Sphaerosporella brunnea]